MHGSGILGSHIPQKALSLAPQRGRSCPSPVTPSHFLALLLTPFSPATKLCQVLFQNVPFYGANLSVGSRKEAEYCVCSGKSVTMYMYIYTLYLRVFQCIYSCMFLFICTLCNRCGLLSLSAYLLEMLWNSCAVSCLEIFYKKTRI